eukprot:g21072.t1
MESADVCRLCTLVSGGRLKSNMKYEDTKKIPSFTKHQVPTKQNKDHQTPQFNQTQLPSVHRFWIHNMFQLLLSRSVARHIIPSNSNLPKSRLCTQLATGTGGSKCKDTVGRPHTEYHTPVPLKHSECRPIVTLILDSAA